jgi:dTMP kinase
MAGGLLITIEGIDGAGKSTLAGALLEALRSRAIAAQLVREPGGVALSERLRAMLADPELHLAPQTEALLYAAARAQLVQELLAPALAEDTVLVLDRFADSSLAYQGAGRGLGIEQVRALNEFATAGLAPDRTLLLALPPGLARERLAAEGGRPERLEREPYEFFEEVAAAYEQLAQAEPERFAVLDATAPAQDVLAAALDALKHDLAGFGSD